MKIIFQKGERKLISITILIALISVVYLSCRKSNDNGSAEDFNELKTWLHANGELFKNETVSFRSGSSTVIEYLDWENLRTETEKGNTYILVPFLAGSSSFSKTDTRSSNAIGETEPLPSNVTLVLYKNSSGQMAAKLRIRKCENQAVYDFYYNMDGKCKYAWMYTLRMGPQRIYRTDSAKQSTITTNSVKKKTTGCASFTLKTFDLSCVASSGSEVTCTYIPIINIYNICAGEESFDPQDPGGGLGGGSGGTNTSAIDSILVNLHNYPCAQSVLNAMPNCNDEVKQLLSDVFNVSADVNLTFIADPNVTGNLDAHTYHTPGGGNLDFTVGINISTLNTASKDYLVAVFIHEGVHAYIDYQRGISAANKDSAAFIAKFPIYWEYRGNDPQHNQMAESYVTFMKGVIKQMNPAIADDVARALAWGGLETTTAWRNLSDTNTIKSINAAGLAGDTTIYKMALCQ